MEVYAAVQVAIVGIRTVIDRRPVGPIAKTEQGRWLIVTAMAVMTIIPVMVPVMVPIMVFVMVFAVTMVAVVMPVMATVLHFVTGHRS